MAKKIFSEIDKQIFILSFGNALLLMGYGMSIPFMSIYLHVERGLPAGVVGAIVAFATLLTSLASGLSGELSDVFGRKKLMNLSLLCRSASMFLIAGAMAMNAHHAWVILFHFLGSFFGAFFRPSSNAWIADHTTPRERIKAFGYIRIGINIGWAAGPAVGGILAGTSFAMAFAFTGFAYLVTSAMLHIKISDSFVKNKERKTKFIDMVKELKKNPLLAKVCFLILLIALVSAQLVTGLSLHGIKYIKLTQAQIGLLFSVNGIVIVALQYFVSKVMTDMRITTAMIIGCVIYGIGYMTVGFAGAFWFAAAGVAMAAIGEMALSPGANTLMSNIAPSHLRGRYLGLQEVSRQSGAAIGMLMAGLMIDHLSPIKPYIPWIIIGFVAFAAAYGFYKIRKYFTPEQDGINQCPIQPIPQTPSDDVQVSAK
ncbi:MFS family permease [Elusimicrobium posterum]|uniref:MDR family MFS transporter n=1 Tax=Elusimicrobium posterum TaxID=3116653 RepID=UPI003C748CD3